MSRNKKYSKSTNGNRGYSTKSDTMSSLMEFFNSRPQEIKDTFTQPFNRPLGNSFRLVDSTFYEPTSASLDEQVHVIPGIMSLDVRFNPGVSLDATSPVNIAANAIYTFVRHINSGAKNYDSADLMLFLMAMDSMYVWYQVLKRVYGVCSVYSSYNRYYPRAIVNAMGFDFDEIVEDLPKFRNIINTFVDKVGSLVIPAMKYYGWHRHIFENVFTDSTSPQAQTYILKPDGFYEYIEKVVGTTPQAGYLQYHPWGYVPGTTETVNYYNINNIIAINNMFMTSLLGSEDIGIMSGDIYKAYGDNTFKIEHITEDYVTQIGFDEDIMNAISNATLQSTYGASTQSNIRQDASIGAGGIIYTPVSGNVTSLASILKQSNHLINLYNEPTPERLVLATRFMTGLLGDYFVHGTEFITKIKIYKFEASSTTPGAVLPTVNVYNMTMYATGATTAVNDLDLLTDFDYAPTYYYGSVNSDGKLVDTLKIYCDTNRYNVITNDQLDLMHLVCAISLWDVPQMGTSK